jgi:polyisoprenyl-teichoic acid--peptidoglycan teichoic acid transferase
MRGLVRSPSGRTTVLAVTAGITAATVVTVAAGVRPNAGGEGPANLIIAALPHHDVTAADLAPSVTGGRSAVLVVGTDRREGLSSSVEATGSLRGERADSVTLWLMAPGEGVRVIAIPRDLRVTVPGHGDHKLAGVLEYGGPVMVQAVTALVGVRPQHYVVIDFDGFSDAVDALGGVDLVLTRPVRDEVTHLALPSGRQHLDGAAALAYARSRRLQELWPDGRWRAGSQGDLARVRQQQQLLAGLLRALSVRDPLSLWRAGLALRRGVWVDPALNGGELAAWTSAMQAHEERLCTLPSRPFVSGDEAWSPFTGRPGSMGFRAPAFVSLDDACR